MNLVEIIVYVLSSWINYKKTIYISFFFYPIYKTKKSLSSQTCQISN
jgi:hypothetical protein